MERKGNSVKILGIGSPIVDVLVNVTDEFIGDIKGAKGGMELVDTSMLNGILERTGKKGIRVPGGSAANTIVGLAKLGMATAFLGKIGNDREGGFYKSFFAGAGVDISRFKLNETMPTGRCLSLITPDAERTMRTDLGAAATLSPKDILTGDFADITHVHLEGYLVFNEALICHILKLAKNASCIVSLDMASFEVVKASMKILPELLRRYVDIVFANEHEAETFCGSNDPEKGLQALSEYCKIAAVKLGEDGALIQSGDRKVKVKAERVHDIDSTGAGDLWGAGFLYGLLKGKPFELCGRYGSILGAEVVKVVGTSIPENRWRIIRRRIKSEKLV